MNTLLFRLISAPLGFFMLICSIYVHKPYGTVYVSSLATQQIQQPLKKNTTSHTITPKVFTDTTFTLKIENDKRIVDDALKAKLTRELKAVITKHSLKKPYKIAMGFTKGARDVETFLFGEQVFYTLAESGFTITGTPLDMPDEAPNAIPQVKLINQTIYIILSKL